MVAWRRIFIDKSKQVFRLHGLMVERRWCCGARCSVVR